MSLLSDALGQYASFSLLSSSSSSSSLLSDPVFVRHILPITIFLQCCVKVMCWLPYQEFSYMREKKNPKHIWTNITLLFKEEITVYDVTLAPPLFPLKSLIVEGFPPLLPLKPAPRPCRPGRRRCPLPLCSSAPPPPHGWL